MHGTICIHNHVYTMYIHAPRVQPPQEYTGEIEYGHPQITDQEELYMHIPTRRVLEHMYMYMFTYGGCTHII